MWDNLAEAEIIRYIEALEAGKKCEASIFK